MATNPLIKPNALTNASLPMSTKENITPSAVIVPKVEVPTSISTAKLGTGTPTVVDNSGVFNNIQTTYDKYGASAGANEAFVKGVIKASGQKETPELIAQYTGKKLGDVISGLGIGEKIIGFGVTPPAIAPEAQKGTSGAQAQSEWEKAGNTGVAPFSQQNEAPKTALQKLQDIQNNYNNSTAENIANQGVVSEYQAKVNKAQVNIQALDEQQSALGAQNSLVALGLKNDFLDFEQSFSKGQGLTKNIAGVQLNNKADSVNFDLSKLSIEDGKNLANYTLARIPLVQNYNIAKGNYDSAFAYAKNIADAYDKSAQFQLDILAQENTISQQDKTALQNQISNEISYMKEGMTAVDDTQIETVKADIISGKSKGATLWTDPITGKSWLKPAMEDEEQKKRDFYSFQKATDALYDAGKITDAERKTMIEEQKSNSSAIEQANSALTYIDEILTSDRLNAVTGLSAQLPTVKPESVATVQKIDSLKNLLTLQNLGFLKGAMSDKDIAFITSASSALNRKMSTSAFKKEIQKIKDVMVRTKLKSGAYNSLEDYYFEVSASEQLKIDTLQKETGVSDEDLLKELKSEAGGFNSVGGDTNTAILNKVVSKEDGTKGGQCGRFVNQITGLGLGDSYESKMAKMDSSITKPEPGMVFVYPYKDTGHTGFIVGIKGDKAIVKDSNFSLDEKVKTHEIALSKITGLRKV